MSSQISNHEFFSFSALLLLLATPYAAAQTGPDTRDSYGYTRVTPSMAIIIVVLVTALFFMGFFSIYIRNCSNSNGNSVRAMGLNNGGRSRRGAATRGLDPAVIETFPTLVYSEVKGLKIGKGALECAVCLNEFEEEETLRLIPKCDHVFHPDCIDAWLASHTTCPVCRANLTPQPGDPPPGISGLNPESDLEAQNENVELEPEDGCADHGNAEVAAPEPEVTSVNRTLNRNRTHGSRSGRPRKFPRSHSTGHSLVQPGENTDRFTLRLPDEVRKQIMNRKLNRALSMVVLPREQSSRRGYRPDGEGSVGKYKRLEKSDQGAKSDRWVFGLTPPFLTRASSFLTRVSSSVRSPRVASNDSEGTSSQPIGPNLPQSGRPPV